MRGRDREKAVVQEMVRAAHAGRGGVLLVEGEPGSGKSSLLRECSAEAARRGLPVSASGGVPSAGHHPAGGLPAAISVTVPVDGASAEKAPARNDRGNGLGRYPGGGQPGYRPDGPALVALDDMQYADLQTLWRLRSLGPPYVQAPLWVLARSTARRGSDAELLFGHLERAGAVRLSLTPLDDAATAQITADQVGVPVGQDLLEMAAGARGNPMLLVELLAGLRDEDGIRISRGAASLKSRDLPQRLRLAVRRWLAEVSPRTRQFLEVGAVLGRSFHFDAAAALLGSTPAGLLPELQAALAAGVLEAAGDRLDFRRELVWRAIAEDVPVPARQALHRQAGEFLLEHGASASDAAAHLISGSRSGDPCVLAQLDRAARSLITLAPQTAAELTLRTLSATGPADPVRFPRTVAAVEALTAAMRLPEAEQMARSALAEPIPVSAATRLRSCLSSILLFSGRPAAAAAAAEQALAGPELTGHARGEAEFALLFGLCASAQAAERVRTRAAGILTAGAGRDDTAVTGALLARALLEWRDGQLEAALDQARQAVRHGCTGTGFASRALPGFLLTALLIPAGCLPEAATVISSLSAQGGSSQAGGWGARQGILRAYLLLASGNTARAVALAQAALPQADAEGAGFLSQLGLSVLATGALRSGDLRSAARYAESCQQRAAAHGPGLGAARCLLVAAQAAEAQGVRREAAQLAADFVALAGQDRSVFLAGPAASAWLVRFMLGQHDRKAASRVALAAEQLAAGNPGLPAVAAAARHARGLLDEDTCALAAAAAGSPDPWASASAAEDAGKLLAERGDLTGAAGRLEDALAGYDRIGALRDARRVRLRLRGLGIRRRHVSHARRPRAGWASLTDTERAVSDLVAQGLTNQKIADEMFLSTHTVAFHLRQVFRKLNISNRAELARVWAEQSHATSSPVESRHAGHRQHAS
ncbi:MAG: LuxR C-terminal-related transcriptional regulator [Streptosporangiaceae bacterium]